MHSVTRFGLILFFLGLALVAPVMVQAQEELCPSFTNRVVSTTASRCASMGAESVCYGFENVQTTVDGNSDPIDISTPPGFNSWLAGTQIVDTSPLDLDTQVYGVAPMRVRANLPVGHAGRDMILMPIGGVEVGNGVPYADALLLPEEEEVDEVVTGANVTLYQEPDSSSPVAGTLPAGTTLFADGMTSDTDWIRVYFEYPGEYSTRAAAWVSRSALEGVDLELLPFIGADAMTPMQKFYFNNTFETSACSGATPGAVLVQGPRGIETEFVVNDADVLITSSVSLDIREPNIMQLRVLDGLAVLCRGTENEFIVPEGFAVELPLNQPRDVEIADRLFHSSDFCGWTNLRLMTPEELAGQALLEQIRTNILNQPVDFPTILCPSPLGCSFIQINDPDTRADVDALCASGAISPDICDRLR